MSYTSFETSEGVKHEKLDVYTYIFQDSKLAFHMKCGTFTKKLKKNQIKKNQCVQTITFIIRLTIHPEEKDMSLTLIGMLSYMYKFLERSSPYI